MEIRNVTVLGAGVLGAQIAFQTAFHGFDVALYDVAESALEAATATFERVGAQMKKGLGVSDAALAAARARVTLSAHLAVAVEIADLVIEAIPERLDLKREMYAKIARLAPPHAIFATNSSTLTPSHLADATGRPDRFLALHFANTIWRNNIAEVMGHAGTDPQVYERVVAFARAIGMEPIELRKEQAGYVLNSLLVPFLHAASSLLMDGVATPSAIDTTWKIATGAPRGPFEIYDIVGLRTAYEISRVGGPKAQAFARHLKENYLDKGKFGVSSGEGFHRYGQAPPQRPPPEPSPALT